MVHLHCENEDIVGFEEAEISEKTKPHQKVPGAWLGRISMLIVVMIVQLLVLQSDAP